MPKTKKEKEIMTAQNLADYLHLHPLTIQRYAREGRIPAFKIGADWRFHKKYIEKWLRQKAVQDFQKCAGQKILFPL